MVILKSTMHTLFLLLANTKLASHLLHGLCATTTVQFNPVVKISMKYAAILMYSFSIATSCSRGHVTCTMHERSMLYCSKGQSCATPVHGPRGYF